MGEALIAAAGEAGIRITLLDTAYLHGGLTPDGYRPLEGVQRRFGDGGTERWHERWSRLTPRGHARIGAALHSVRAFSADDGYQDFARLTEGVPTHVHLSEQPAENEACLAVHGRTPARAAGGRGLLAAAHHRRARHAPDRARTSRLLGDARATVCMCPTTERDLADGIGPAARLAAAGTPLSLGSDSHAVIDLLEEARATGARRAAAQPHPRPLDAPPGCCAPPPRTATRASAGRRPAGSTPARSPTSPRSRWTPRAPPGPLPELGAETAVFAATAADVRHTVVGGRHVVRDGQHQLVPDVPAALAEAVAALRD